MGQNFKHLEICDFSHWTVSLHQDQNYLGRMIIMYKKGLDFDITDLSSKEATELFLVMKKTKKALDSLFSPDYYNWTKQTNVLHKLHLHLIPRYSTIRDFDDIRFTDKRFGKNSAPIDSPKILSDQNYQKLKKLIYQKLIL